MCRKSQELAAPLPVAAPVERARPVPRGKRGSGAQPPAARRVRVPPRGSRQSCSPPTDPGETTVAPRAAPSPSRRHNRSALLTTTPAPVSSDVSRRRFFVSSDPQDRRASPLASRVRLHPRASLGRSPGAWEARRSGGPRPRGRAPKRS